jgi:hypothetical protein
MKSYYLVASVKWAALLSLLGVALTLLVVSVPASVYEGRIRSAFLDGAVSGDNYPWYTQGLSYDGFSDCALLMSLVDRTSFLQDAFRAATYPDENNGSPCGALQRKIFTGNPGVKLVRPIRYWNGARVALLPLVVFSYRQVLGCFIILYYLIPIITCCRLFRVNRRAFYGLLPILTGVVAFSAAPLFAPSIAFVPGMLVTGLAILGLVLLDNASFKYQMMLACACWAAQLFFEAMLGNLVIALSIMWAAQIVLCSVRSHFQRPMALLGKVSLTGTSFCLGAVSVALTKIVVSAAVVGGLGASAAEYTGALTKNMRLDDVSIDSICWLLWGAREELTGDPNSAAALIGLGFAAWVVVVVLAVWGLLRRNRFLAASAAAFLSAASPCVLWLLVLRNHVTLHPWMDIRVISPLISLALTACWCCWQCCRIDDWDDDPAG